MKTVATVLALTLTWAYASAYCGEPPVGPLCDCTRGVPFWHEVGGDCQFACKQGDILWTCGQLAQNPDPITHCGQPPAKPPCECYRGVPFWTDTSDGGCNFACKLGDMLLTCEQDTPPESDPNCGQPPVKPPCECKTGVPFWKVLDDGSCEFSCRRRADYLTCEEDGLEGSQSVIWTPNITLCLGLVIFSNLF